MARLGIRLVPTAIALAALFAIPVMAAKLRISPIGIDMASTERAAAITVANNDSEPISLQVRIFKWSQVAGEEKLEPTTDMLASPPSITVPGGKSYTIRVARGQVAPVSRELSYRLLIDELPKPADPRTVRPGVQTVLRTSMPVFVADKKAIADLTWTVWQDSEGLHARAINRGGRHAKVAGLTLTPAEGPPVVFGRGLNGYVLAGATKDFVLPADPQAALPRLAGPATLTAKNNALDIRASVTIEAQ